MQDHDIDTLTIGQAREAIERGKAIEKIIGNRAADTPAADTQQFDGTQIVILDRGFVYVGSVSLHDQWLTIRNAQNVRRWGTTKGLGELAKSGPTSSSVLDPAGTVRAPMRAVIGLIQCEAASWTKK